MLVVGDKIHYRTQKAMLDHMTRLAKEGIQTDFDYSKDKLTLVVTEIEGSVSEIAKNEC